MTKYVLIILCSLLSRTLLSQTFTILGEITDRGNKRPLSFANIRIDSSNIGTSANIDGTYILKLEKGNYKLIASFIGYKSDTINLRLNMDIPINFKLQRSPIKLDEITILPTENPVLEKKKTQIFQ